MAQSDPHSILWKKLKPRIYGMEHIVGHIDTHELEPKTSYSQLRTLAYIIIYFLKKTAAPSFIPLSQNRSKACMDRKPLC
jgi:hypothetical protein